mmetsp:Transcript_19569/g.47805  ORF Transcript_19569/g.47805 Transcript_19569/m.47805 type:complete len:282 (-) Transcript_19569:365-1210(-)
MGTDAAKKIKSILPQFESLSNGMKAAVVAGGVSLLLLMYVALAPADTPVLPKPLTPSIKLARSKRDTPYLKEKTIILDSIEIDIPAVEPGIWASGNTMLDVGAGGGEIDLYFKEKYGMEIKAIDVLPPEENQRWAFGDNANSKGGFPIDVFDGANLPGKDKSYDVVMFNSVLHHAANNQKKLLQEAARVSKKWIVIIEDTEIPDHADRKFRERISKRHKKHDPDGIFRSTNDWLFFIHDNIKPEGFEVTGWGNLGKTKDGVKKELIDYKGSFQRYFVCRRL